MAVSRKQDADIAELCRSLGYTEAAHPFGYGYMVRTEGDLKLAVERFRERVGKDPITFNWKPGSLILSAEPSSSSEEFFRARGRITPSTARQVEPASARPGAGHSEPGPVAERDGRSPGVEGPVGAVVRPVETFDSQQDTQPLPELPGLDARCDICGGDLLTDPRGQSLCWCAP